MSDGFLSKPCNQEFHCTSWSRAKCKLMKEVYIFEYFSLTVFRFLWAIVDPALKNLPEVTPLHEPKNNMIPTRVWKQSLILICEFWNQEGQKILYCYFKHKRSHQTIQIFTCRTCPKGVTPWIQNSSFPAFQPTNLRTSCPCPTTRSFSAPTGTNLKTYFNGRSYFHNVKLSPIFYDFIRK